MGSSNGSLQVFCYIFHRGRQFSYIETTDFPTQCWSSLSIFSAHPGKSSKVQRFPYRFIMFWMASILKFISFASFLIVNPFFVWYLCKISFLTLFESGFIAIFSEGIFQQKLLTSLSTDVYDRMTKKMKNMLMCTRARAMSLSCL